MGPLFSGTAFILLGLSVAAIGVASAGADVGVAVPMIPIGLYVLLCGGGKLLQLGSGDLNRARDQLKPMELTALGAIGIGVVCVFIGVSMTAAVFAMPLIFLGLGGVAWGLRRLDAQAVELSGMHADPAQGTRMSDLPAARPLTACHRVPASRGVASGRLSHALPRNPAYAAGRARAKTPASVGPRSSMRIGA